MATAALRVLESHETIEKLQGGCGVLRAKTHSSPDWINAQA
jgi:hypothetical protein